jgi:hypothetical protein
MRHEHVLTQGRKGPVVLELVARVVLLGAFGRTSTMSVGFMTVNESDVINLPWPADDRDIA